MSDELNKNDGGLGKPARGRPRKDAGVSGASNGAQKPAAGEPEPIAGIESAAGGERTDQRSQEQRPNGIPRPVDPLDIREPDDDSGGGPRRRRARGPNKPKEEKNGNIAAFQIQDLLISGAAMLAAVAKTPEWEMDAERADKIEKATMTLSELYPVGFNRKLIAWTNFGFAFGGWFVPGAIAWWNHPPKPGPRRVIQMGGQQQTAPVQQQQQAAPEPRGLPIVGPGAHDQTTAKVPSEMWQQPGDIMEVDVANEVPGE